MRAKFLRKIFSLVIIFVFLSNTALYDTHYFIERNLPAKNHLRPQHTDIKLIATSLRDSHVEQRAQELISIIQQLDSLGFNPRINGRRLIEIRNPMELYHQLERFCVVKDLCDIKIILEARVKIAQGVEGPDVIDKDVALMLYNSLFEQQQLMQSGEPLKITLFRGGRGASDFTKYIKKIMPNAEITQMLGATDDGRSWFIAAQDFNATGIPDCGKSLLDLATDEKTAKFLGVRFKGSNKEELEKGFDQLVRKLNGEPVEITVRQAQPLFGYAMEIEASKRAKLVEYLTTFRNIYRSKSQTFTFDDIPMRSIAIVGAAWCLGSPENPAWQRAAEEIGNTLGIGNSCVVFPTLKRQHMVGLTEDGTIYFSETGINENPKAADFVGIWLLDKMPDIEGFTRDLNDFLQGQRYPNIKNIDLTNVEIGAEDRDGAFLRGQDINGNPIDAGLQDEIMKTTRKIRRSNSVKVKLVADYLASLSTTADAKATTLDLTSQAKISIENANIIVYCPSTLESNIGSALIVPGIKKAIERSGAIKLNFVNLTIEADRTETTAMSMVSRLFGYLSGQQPFETERTDWTKARACLDYAIGKAERYTGMERSKTYIPFDADVIKTTTGGEIKTVTLDLEDPTAKHVEDKAYGGYRDQYGFYSPGLMTETMIALYGIRKSGYEITTEGKLVLADAVDFIINKDSAREMAVMLINKYPPRQIPYILEGISNKLISKFLLNPNTELYIRQFYAALIKQSLFLEDAEASKVIQIIARQTLNIMTYIKCDIPEAKDIKVTADPDKMATSPKGESYLNLLTMARVPAKTEGDLGYFFRGTEDTGKLGNGVNTDDEFIQCTQYDHDRYQRIAGALQMYVMNHGFSPASGEMLITTANHKISTIHHTAFVHDIMPGSILCTSTGIGHYQRDKLDIKQWRTGRMLQFNVRYNNKGGIEEVLVQPFDEKHPIAIALPGYVDYMVNLEGQSEFFDISIQLNDQELQKINQAYDKTAEADIEATVKNTKFPPYSVLFTGNRHYMLKAAEGEFNATWIEGPTAIIKQFTGGADLLAFYTSLDEHRLYGLVESIASSAKDIKGPCADKAKLPAITKDQAKARISKLKEIITRSAEEPIITIPAVKHYAWGGVANQIASGMQPDPANPIAEIWFESTQNDGLSIIPDTQIGDIAPITLKELIKCHPEILGDSLGSKDFFVKFLCTGFPPEAYEGFTQDIKGVTLTRFIKYAQRERTYLFELLSKLNIKSKEELEAFKAEYTRWCNHQASCNWRDTGSGKDALPYLHQFIKEDQAGSINQLLARMRENRHNIVSTFHLFSFDTAHSILSPANQPHGILGLSLQSHPTRGPDAKYEAWIPITVTDQDGREHIILVEVQQTSNVTNSFADFYTPFVWNDTEGKVEMRKKLAKRPTTSPEDLIKAESDAIREMVLEGLSGQPTKPEDFRIRPKTIYERGDGLIKREIILGDLRREIWPRELFSVHRVTFAKGAKGYGYEVMPLEEENNFHTILVVEGEVTVSLRNGKKIRLAMGETDTPKSLFMGAELKEPYEIISNGEAQVLIIYQPLPKTLEPAKSKEVLSATKASARPAEERTALIDTICELLTIRGATDISRGQVEYLEVMHNHPHTLVDIPLDKKADRLADQHLCLVETARRYVEMLRQNPDAEDNYLFVQRPYPAAADDTDNPENVIEIAAIGKYGDRDNAILELGSLLRDAGWEFGEKVWSAEVAAVAGEALPEQALSKRAPVMVVFELKVRDGERYFGKISDADVDNFAKKCMDQGKHVFYKVTEEGGRVHLINVNAQERLVDILRQHTLETLLSGAA